MARGQHHDPRRRARTGARRGPQRLARRDVGTRRSSTVARRSTRSTTTCASSTSRWGRCRPRMRPRRASGRMSRSATSRQRRPLRPAARRDAGAGRGRAERARGAAGVAAGAAPPRHVARAERCATVDCSPATIGDSHPERGRAEDHAAPERTSTRRRRCRGQSAEASTSPVCAGGLGVRAGRAERSDRDDDHALLVIEGEAVRASRQHVVAIRWCSVVGCHRRRGLRRSAPAPW